MSILQLELALDSNKLLLHKKWACQKKNITAIEQGISIGLKRILIRFAKHSEEQVGFSETDEISMLTHVLPYLLPYGLDILIESWKTQVIEYALKQGVKGFYDISGLQDSGLIKLACEHQCSVIVPYQFYLPFLNTFNVLEEPIIDELMSYSNDYVSQLKTMGLENVLIDPFALGLKQNPLHFKHMIAICRHIKLLSDVGLQVFIPLLRKLSPVQQSAVLTLALEHEASCIHSSDLASLNDILFEWV